MRPTCTMLILPNNIVKNKTTVDSITLLPTIKIYFSTFKHRTTYLCTVVRCTLLCVILILVIAIEGSSNKGDSFIPANNIVKTTHNNNLVIDVEQKNIVFANIASGFLKSASRN